jgi:DNA-binding transcriptional LysR family regulator
MLNLRSLDLNLLVTLDVLLAEHNVSRAARRLHYSQPAVSVHLAKLRDMLGDPLLLPGPRGMQPTAYAEQLRAPLREALEALGRAVAPAAPFDPGSAGDTWRVAAADYGEAAIVLPALARLRAAAPGTRLAVVQAMPRRIARQAERGDIDLAFHTSEWAPPGLHRQALFDERYVLAGRRDHPQLKRRPSLARFCELEHAIVSPDGAGFHGGTDEALARLGRSRRVVLSVPHFLVLLRVLEASNLVAMLPARLVADQPGLRVVEPPLEVPGFEMAMYWHERSHRDPAHQWLRAFFAGGAGGSEAG